MFFCRIGKLGEGREHVVEIDTVVPDEEVVADGRPSLQRPHKVAARGVVRQGHLALAVNVAKHDVDVGPRLDMFGRVHRVEVGQRRKLLVGEAVGQPVQEVDEAARRPALALVERPTRGAGAVGEVAVVLAHRDRVHPGVGPEDRVDLRADHLEELGIGQTPLARLARTPLAVDEGVVFGVAPTVDLRRQDAVEGVDPVAAGEGLLRLLEAEPVAVEGFGHRIALALPVAECRILGVIQCGDRHVAAPGQPPGVVSVAGDAEVLLQQGHHAVNGPLAASVGDHQPPVAGLQPEAVLGQSTGIPGAEDNVAATGLSRRHDGQPRPADASDELLQQRRRPHVHRIGRIGDNPRHGLSMPYDAHLRRRRDRRSHQAQGAQPVYDLHILQYFGLKFGFRQAVSVRQVSTLPREITKRSHFYDKSPAGRQYNRLHLA